VSRLVLSQPFKKVVSMTKKCKSLSLVTLGIYWQHARKYWPMLILSAISILVIIASDLAFPFVYKWLLDHLATSRFDVDINIVYRTILYIGLIMVCSWSGWQTLLYAINQFESKTMRDLLDYCFEYLQMHSNKFFTDNFAGALVKRVNRFSAGFEAIADQFTLEMGQTVLRILFLIGVLSWRNTMLGTVFLIWTIAFIVFNVGFARWKLKFDLARAAMDTKVTAQLADTIANAVNLKLFAGTEREVMYFKEVTELHHQVRYKTWSLGQRSDGVQGASVRILELIILVMAVKYWYAGILTVGDFIFLRLYMSQLTEQVRSVGKNVRRIYEVMADSNEMTEILVRPHEIVDVSGAKALEVPQGVIEFRDVRFAYAEDHRLILQDLSFITKPGERIGVVGPSGGGKSTILKVLVRLHDICEGQILIDGQDITGVTQASLHRNIAFVPQDPTLFHRTLMDNIRYSRPDATDDEVIEAARLAHCHEFISHFPLGYKTLVGERGIKLSGGERQRIAIARAILSNAPILVLDEATSSLDSESEAFIQDSLSQLMVGRTVVAIAHRLSTIQKMDRIIVVKNGQIVEEGNHDELVSVEDGHYQRLWGLQSATYER
jgi:ATP-binding cassette, subfamily B, bacterial